MCELVITEYEDTGIPTPEGLVALRNRASGGVPFRTEIFSYVVTLLTFRDRLYLCDSSPDTSMFPMREVPPVWHAPVPAVGNNAAVPGHFQHIWVHTPWKRTETYAFKAALPDPRKNPAGYYKELKQTLDSCVMTLSDIDLLMAAVVPPDILDMLLNSGVPGQHLKELSLHEQGEQNLNQ
ncbi:hypothetical protein NDU88_000717 [Pleurodeles waltl]|uniref:Uncharacterized protein n=1 Tax=Pleurodeles waltl TaxID=8319 RepID=A0AAV7U4I0_PLEWA|nr:hypothetical protein NDU88_000717 [Pleurodeles waltl]